MNMDDFRDDLTPGQVLARELRHSRNTVERNDKCIAEAEGRIASCKAENAAELARQETFRAALERLVVPGQPLDQLPVAVDA